MLFKQLHPHRTLHHNYWEHALCMFLTLSLRHCAPKHLRLPDDNFSKLHQTSFEALLASMFQLRIRLYPKSHHSQLLWIAKKNIADCCRIWMLQRLASRAWDVYWFMVLLTTKKVMRPGYCIDDYVLVFPLSLWKILIVSLYNLRNSSLSPTSICSNTLRFVCSSKFITLISLGFKANLTFK